MYRHGLGDCFLITLPRKASPDPYRILIDCGVILGTANASDMMTKVVEDIVHESNGKIDLLILTHQHWDHLSGFVQAEASFAKLKIGDVWVAWTENPADDLANKLRGERKQALASLRLGVGAMRMAGDADAASEIEGLLGFFGAAGGASTEDALAKAIGLAKGKVRYCLPADPPVSIDDTDARLFILGPPHDEKLIRQTLPSTKDPETYGVAATALGATVMAALSADDNSAPFDDFRSIRPPQRRGWTFFGVGILDRAGMRRRGGESTPLGLTARPSLRWRSTAPRTTPASCWRSSSRARMSSFCGGRTSRQLVIVAESEVELR